MKKVFYGWWVVAAAFVTFGLFGRAAVLQHSVLATTTSKGPYHWRRVDITRGFFYATLLTLWVGRCW